MSPYLLVFVGPVVATVAAGFGGWTVLLPPLVLFALIPALDQILPQNRDNTPGDPRLRWLCFAFVPAHLASLAFALGRALDGGNSPAEAVALVLGAGFSTATAINVAHELMHRPGRLEQGLAAVLMASASYTHFCVEHVQGHHKHVGTPKDPATARLGESLYAFLPRSLVGGLRSAWAIERARSGLGPNNRLVRWGLAQALLLGAIVAFAGPWALLAFLGQGLVAVDRKSVV